jgi:hypothetical protein
MLESVICEPTFKLKLGDEHWPLITQRGEKEKGRPKPPFPFGWLRMRTAWI